MIVPSILTGRANSPPLARPGLRSSTIDDVEVRDDPSQAVAHRPQDAQVLQQAAESNFQCCLPIRAALDAAAAV
jgi:hypothetical protein